MICAVASKCQKNYLLMRIEIEEFLKVGKKANIDELALRHNTVQVWLSCVNHSMSLNDSATIGSHQN